MNTALEVANLATAHTGHGEEILSLDENSEEGAVVRKYLMTTRNAILKRFDWDFARRPDVPLALLETRTDPTEQWTYAYLYPADCLRLIELKCGYPFGFGLINGRNHILTNLDKAEGTYISNQIPDRYPEDFALAWSFHLALLIAPSLTKANITTLRGDLEKKYKVALDEAIENNSNESSRDYSVSPAIQAGGWVYEVV